MANVSLWFSQNLASFLPSDDSYQSGSMKVITCFLWDIYIQLTIIFLNSLWHRKCNTLGGKCNQPSSIWMSSQMPMIIITDWENMQCLSSTNNGKFCSFYFYFLLFYLFWLIFGRWGEHISIIPLGSQLVVNLKERPGKNRKKGGIE